MAGTDPGLFFTKKILQIDEFAKEDLSISNDDFTDKVMCCTSNDELYAQMLLA